MLAPGFGQNARAFELINTHNALDNPATTDNIGTPIFMSEKEHYVAIDIGAGLGAKIGLFADPHHMLVEGLLLATDFGGSIDKMAQALADYIAGLQKKCGRSMKDARAIGIASPGLFRSDGTYQLAANLPFLNNQNLRQRMEEATGLPTGIENDANAGGLAEWSVLRLELIYWVFGGGWGGAWISQDGNVRFPALDWDGNDASLHYTNEPGYAIALNKRLLRTVFYQFGASYERFEEIAVEDLNPPDGKLLGPCGSTSDIRAEVILSGPGRCRLFRAVVTDDFYERFLDIRESKQMTDPSVAGQHISKLSNMRVEAAVQTDRLFGHILATATQTMVRQARRDGLGDGAPICLGGKPRYALPYFGPSAQGRLGAMGIMNYLRPSVIDERGFNANLVGAAVVAEKTYTQSKEADD